MKAIIVYDSEFGNTEQIARAIGSALASPEEVPVMRVNAVKPDQLRGVEVLIVGSPTQRFRPLPAILSLLTEIPPNGLKGVKVAAFDTRLTMREINKTPILAFFVKLFGASAYAAKSIANSLKKKGGILAVPSEGFYVEGMKGPLVQGELERAANWARKLSAKIP